MKIRKSIIVLALALFAAPLFGQYGGGNVQPTDEFLTKQNAISRSLGESAVSFTKQESVIGFYAKEFQGGHTCVVLAREAGAYYLHFFSHGMPAATKVKIDDELGRNLEKILKTEIARAQQHGRIGLGGMSFAFGVRENGVWKYANIWNPQGRKVPRLMGEIGMAKGVAEIQKAVDEILALSAAATNKVSDSAKHLTKEGEKL